MVMASQQVTVILFLCALQGVYVPGVESLCTNGFTDNLMDTDIQSISTWSTFGSPSQWVFPSIKFTCTGARITGWAFRARYNEFGPSAMLMQIWRYDETEGLYSKVQSSGSLNELVSPDNQIHGQSYVYEYNLDTPITVEENDLFGAEWSNTNERTQLEMWDKGNGNAPVSYRIQQRTDNIRPTAGQYMGMADRRFIPLVSVIIEENLSTTTTVALMPSPSSQLAPTTRLSPLSSTPAKTVALMPSPSGQLAPTTRLSSLSSAPAKTVALMPSPSGQLATAPTTRLSPLSSAPATSVTPVMEPDVGGGPNVVGVAVGLIVVVLVLVAVLVVTIAVCVYRRTRNTLYDIVKPRSRDLTTNPTYNNNAVGMVLEQHDSGYDVVGPPSSEQFDGDYLEPVKSVKQNTVYRELGLQDVPGPYANTSFVGKSLQLTQHRDQEPVYMAPARDEQAIYEQYKRMDIQRISREEIRIKSRLGSGNFGTVDKGDWILPDKTVEVAVKVLKLGSDIPDKVKFLQEAAIMGQFKHPNIVTLHGVIIQGQPKMLILELLSKGDLKNFLSTLNPNFVGEELLLSFCRQIASGLNYLASRAFVHRDLAARNILLTEDVTCKIADFGMSRDLMDEDYYTAHGGLIPIKWTSPEALRFKKYSTASDVWSFGVVMYEIWSLGHKPYEGYSNAQALSMVDQGFRLPPPPGCPRALYELMIKCWHPEMSGRPDSATVVQYLSHPDVKLLRWLEEDRAVSIMAATLGADLEAAAELYKDLQMTYSRS